MKLSEGVKIAIGAKTYKGEVPDRVLEASGLKAVVTDANKAADANAKKAQDQIAADEKLEAKRAAKKKKAAQARAALLTPPPEKAEEAPPAPAPSKK
jgi:hypothetical protein